MRVTCVLCALLFGTLAATAPLPHGAPATAAQEQSAALSGEVGAGERHVTRLRDLPRGAELEVDVTTDGRLRVLLLDEAQYAEMPNPARPLFAGSGETRVRFQIAIPASGTHYLVLDNGQASVPRRFDLKVRARAGVAGGDSVRADTAGELERFQANLRRMFMFEDLDFHLSACDSTEEAASGETVTICSGVGALALRHLDEPAKARDVALFLMLHEVGRALLHQWEHPEAAQQRTADEFAVVLHTVYGQSERLDSMLAFLDAATGDRGRNDAATEARLRRAGDLRRAIADDGLARAWQPFLVRHMQTDILQALATRPTPWTDVDAVHRELARR